MKLIPFVSSFSLALSLFLVSGVLMISPVSGHASEQCTECHKDPDFKVKDQKLFDYFERWELSTHKEAGVLCSDCHGGNSSAKNKESAHAGVFPPSDSKSLLFYKNLPKTCGECHDRIFSSFSQSKHYKNLLDKGAGPNCITCHESMNTRVSYGSKLLDNCRTCHNEFTKNHPEVVSTAQEVLHHLNSSNGYRQWAALHFKAEDLKETEALREQITESWHQFQFENLTETSIQLVDKLRIKFDQYRKSLKQQKSEDEKGK